MDYYRRNAKAYFDATLSVDMTPLYERFLRRLPEKASILDAGCGSGRDTLAFRRMGHEVVPFDASPELAALAEAFLGSPVEVLRFQDMAWEDRFDGAWACASLLHVPYDELPDVLLRLERALKPGGVLYASFKYGRGEREVEGRRFTDLDEEALAGLLHRVPGLSLLETWVTPDRRKGREKERWLNLLLRREGPG